MWDYSTGQMLHTENLKEASDEEMEKAVRSVAVFKAKPSLSIIAVLLDRLAVKSVFILFTTRVNSKKFEIFIFFSLHRIPNVFVFKISDEPLKFQRQVLPFTSQPLEATFTEEGSLYVLTDNSSNPIEVFLKDEASQYNLSESALVTTLLANPAHLKIVQGSICQIFFLILKGYYLLTIFS